MYDNKKNMVFVAIILLSIIINDIFGSYINNRFENSIRSSLVAGVYPAMTSRNLTDRKETNREINNNFSINNRNKNIEISEVKLKMFEILFKDEKEEFKNLEKGIELYITTKLKRKHKNDEEYISKLITSYMSLMNEEKKNEVLFFIALCAIESNYDQTSTRNPNGAPIGISQVIWRYHKDTILKANISYDEFYHKPEANIIGGFYVFKKYLRGAGNILKKACQWYSGGATGYYNKVYREYYKLNKYIEIAKML
jgi:hypothetical protein